MTHRQVPHRGQHYAVEAEDGAGLAVIVCIDAGQRGIHGSSQSFAYSHLHTAQDNLRALERDSYESPCRVRAAELK